MLCAFNEFRNPNSTYCHSMCWRPHWFNSHIEWKRQFPNGFFSTIVCAILFMLHLISVVQLPLLFGPAPCCFLFFYQCCAVVVVDVVIETNIHLRAHLLYFANWIPKRIGSLICEKKRFEIQRISIKIQSTCIPSKLFVTQCHMKPVSNDSLMPLLDMINNTVNSKKQKPKMFEILFRRFDSIRFNWIRARYV